MKSKWQGKETGRDWWRLHCGAARYVIFKDSGVGASGRSRVFPLKSEKAKEVKNISRVTVFPGKVPGSNSRQCGDTPTGS